MGEPVDNAPPTEAEQALLDQAMMDVFIGQAMLQQGIISGLVNKSINSVRENTG